MKGEGPGPAPVRSGSAPGRDFRPESRTPPASTAARAAGDSAASAARGRAGAGGSPAHPPLSSGRVRRRGNAQSLPGWPPENTARRNTPVPSRACPARFPIQLAISGGCALRRPIASRPGNWRGRCVFEVVSQRGHAVTHRAGSRSRGIAAPPRRCWLRKAHRCRCYRRPHRPRLIASQRISFGSKRRTVACRCKLKYQCGWLVHRVTCGSPADSAGNRAAGVMRDIGAGWGERRKPVDAGGASGIGLIVMISLPSAARTACLLSLRRLSTPSPRSSKKTIRSVLAQDYPADRISGHGWRLHRWHARNSERYRGRIEFVSAPDGGASDAINRGFRKARGEILAWLGADDLYLPRAISGAAVAGLAEDPTRGGRLWRRLLDRRGWPDSRPLSHGGALLAGRVPPRMSHLPAVLFHAARGA